MDIYRKKIVPVLMYHSIGIGSHPWVWSYMSERLDSFEELLRMLVEHKYRTIGLDELYAFMSGDEPLAQRSVVLTFDDGYLDNWVYIAPLLRKYGLKGVVYVSPEFVQESAEPRPTLEDVREGRLPESELETVGFMNWAELRELDREGVLDVQSHAMTHTWYPASGEIVDFHRHMNCHRYPWLSWNARPDRKPYYLSEDQQGFVPRGTPIFSHQKSMVVRRFFPDESLVKRITAYVRDELEASGEPLSTWQESVQKKFSADLDDGKVPGRFETTEQKDERILAELRDARAIIESRLDKTVSYLAWPGGGVDEGAIKHARTAGYKSWTLSSWQEPEKRNMSSTDPEKIKRISGSTIVHWQGSAIADGGANWVMNRIRVHQRSLSGRVAAGIRKITWLLQRRLQVK